MKKIAFSILVALNIFLIRTLVNSIKSEVELLQNTRELESKIIGKLNFIRDLQRVHKSQKGLYAKSWKGLEKFSIEDSIYFISVKELVEFNPITQTDKISHLTDTLGAVSVWDSLYSGSIYKPCDLSLVPDLGRAYNFEISVDIANIQGVEIEVLQVKCPVYTNPKKRGKKLKFGSLESPTLAGNWN